MMQTQDILATLKSILQETFEIDPAAVTPEAHLYQDLDLDSLDAVDLVIRLQDLTGKKISPDAFKQVRTVGDVVAAVEQLIQAA